MYRHLVSAESEERNPRSGLQCGGESGQLYHPRRCCRLHMISLFFYVFDNVSIVSNVKKINKITARILNVFMMIVDIQQAAWKTWVVFSVFPSLRCFFLLKHVFLFFYASSMKRRFTILAMNYLPTHKQRILWKNTFYLFFFFPQFCNIFIFSKILTKGNWTFKFYLLSFLLFFFFISYRLLLVHIDVKGRLLLFMGLYQYHIIVYCKINISKFL